MGDFEDGECLSEGHERLESFQEAVEPFMGEENGDEEGRSEGDDSPQGEADAIVC